MRLGPYRIVGLLGAGGMGEVYRATDTRLDRQVAIKVLKGALSDDERLRRRLEREAKTISQLQHPHICMLLDVGGGDGATAAPFYLVMEYLEGETLEARLRRGPLAPADALRIGSEIAEAIDAAHRSGVVHRDLKPGNVMLTANGVKVLDFGIAKGLGAPVVDSTSESPTLTGPLTEEGVLAGTVPYMAPEQLEGKQPDRRSDLWALGCLLYEMVVGARPFRGATQVSLIGAIMQSQPEPASKRQPLSPDRLDRVLERCLEKNPDRRWQSARDIALELESIAGATRGTSPAVSATQPQSTLSDTQRVAGITRSRSMRRLAAVAAGVLTAAMAIGAGWWILGRRSSEEAQPASGLRGLAVLAFEPLADDADLRQLARGIPETISTRYASAGLRVLLPEIVPVHGEDVCVGTARAGVRFVIEGSVLRAHDRVRVQARLIGCPEAERLWGGSFDQDAADLLGAQDELAGAIVAATEGLMHFGRDNDFWMPDLERLTKADNARALEAVRESIVESPRDVRLLCGLLLIRQQSLMEGWAESPAQVLAEMIETGERCRAIAPRDWGCQGMPGWAYGFAGDGERMVAAFERGLELTGRQFPHAHAILGGGLALVGRTDESLTALDQAIRLSPDDALLPEWMQWRANALAISERYDEARSAALESLSFNANNFTNYRANVYQVLAASNAHLGRIDEARAALEEALALRPALTLEVAALPFSAASAQQRDRYLEGLRLAGLGEDGVVGATEPRRKMIVVLPFDNLGPAEQADFAAGVSEEIRAKLAALAGLGVISRNSALHSAEAGKTIRQMGAELGVDFVLDGTVRWAGDRVRIQPQLIRVTDDTRLWEEPFDHVLSVENLLAVQSEIAARVARQVDASLPQHAVAAPASMTASIGAYQAYLRGIAVRERFSIARLEQAGERFDRAVELDPGFGLAWANLAEVHSSLFHLGDQGAKRLAAADRAVERAIALGPNLPETHRALGYYYDYVKRRLDQAESELALAAASLPSDSDVLALMSFIRFQRGDFERGLALAEREQRLDPTSSAALYNLGWPRMYLRQYERADQAFARLIARDPEHKAAPWARAWNTAQWKGYQAADALTSETVLLRWRVELARMVGRYDEALSLIDDLPPQGEEWTNYTIPKDLHRAWVYRDRGNTALAAKHFESARRALEQVLEERPLDDRVHSALGHAYAGLGRKEKAVAHGKRGFELKRPSETAVNGVFRLQDLAMIYAQVGEPEHALDCLEDLLGRPAPFSVRIMEADPAFTPLRDHPRYRALVQRYG